MNIINLIQINRLLIKKSINKFLINESKRGLIKIFSDYRFEREIRRIQKRRK